ncbi:DNA mismatch repair protein [Tenacibaculum finnmarkense]|uniref:Sau3AI family type II restriction endonuclease n=1 Tax=Tenacibaculum finnmarkense TaxID=2781243 RepID=UPI001EFABBC1|nr:Sau3AI family type II restriction endonuclease [Tenacibaculum finnmarkense]MCG8893964.1 DNA mismatch repair protein [Tenacibaculum finnmarkense]MCG8902474.1 DNA mismatch repair protein [Tenacibaculum finnmarkense]
MFDSSSVKSIVSYAQKLKNYTLREKCGQEIENHGYNGKGNFGQLLEKFYFGYEPNSKAEPDFIEVGMELKSSPLKTLKNGEIRSKERLVLNIINYLKVHEEEFEDSSFWKKNAHLLLIFYLHDKEKDLLDYLIKLVDDWQYPDEDLLMIKRDWEIINQKIRDGKAHELSEGDTFYLGACTKGSTALKSLRNQPFNELKAKQRAYSLKQGYVNHIIASISKKETEVYGKILTPKIKFKKSLSIEEIVISKFEPFYGKTPLEIEKNFNLKLNKKAKSYFANLTKAILGIGLNKKIEEFEKADVQVKTVRLKENNLPDQHISFPIFKYQEIIDSNWDNSNFKNILEQKFFFVFYQFENKKLILKKIKFWNMSNADIEDTKVVWDKTVETIKEGKIVKEIKNGRRFTYFPNSSEHRISHVRPHATDIYKNVNSLPKKDKLTKVEEYTNHSFWLNAKYVKDEIYLK